MKPGVATMTSMAIESCYFKFNCTTQSRLSGLILIPDNSALSSLNQVYKIILSL